MTFPKNVYVMLLNESMKDILSLVVMATPSSEGASLKVSHKHDLLPKLKGKVIFLQNVLVLNFLVLQLRLRISTFVPNFSSIKPKFRPEQKMAKRLIGDQNLNMRSESAS